MGRAREGDEMFWKRVVVAGGILILGVWLGAFVTPVLGILFGAVAGVIFGASLVDKFVP